MTEFWEESETLGRGVRGKEDTHTPQKGRMAPHPSLSFQPRPSLPLFHHTCVVFVFWPAHGFFCFAHTPHTPIHSQAHTTAPCGAVALTPCARTHSAHEKKKNKAHHHHSHHHPIFCFVLKDGLGEKKKPRTTTTRRYPHQTLPHSFTWCP